MKVVMEDGSEMEYGPDDALVIPPGHDAWIVGDEPCVVLDFAGRMSTPREPGLRADWGYTE